MTNDKPVAIGDRGKKTIQTPCVICETSITLAGHMLIDYDGYPLMAGNVRKDFTFPDGTRKDGILCDKCNDNVRNDHLYKLVNQNGKWLWKKV